MNPRMHSNGKGISASALPYRRSQPSWSKATPEDVQEQIFKLAKRGLAPSQIGVILRDSHGVPQVKYVTGNKILRILKTNGGFSDTVMEWKQRAGMEDSSGFRRRMEDTTKAETGFKEPARVLDGGMDT